MSTRKTLVLENGTPEIAAAIVGRLADRVELIDSDAARGNRDAIVLRFGEGDEQGALPLLRAPSIPESPEALEWFLRWLAAELDQRCAPEALLVRAAGACLLWVDGGDRVRLYNRLPGQGSRPPENEPTAVDRDVRGALAPLVFEDCDLIAAMAEVRRTGCSTRVAALRPGAKGAEERWDVRIRAIDGAQAGDLLLQFTPTDDDRASRSSETYRQFSQDVLRSLGSGLAVVDDRGAVQVTNEPAAGILGATREDLRRGGLAAILGDETAADVLAGKYDEASNGPFEVLRRLPDGREIHVGFSLSPLSDHNDRRRGRILHFKDVTEITRLKQQVVHQEKMAAVGSLAGGVAHEFNNLIGGMLGYAQLARATREPADYEKCIEVVHESSMRAKDIVTSLLTFARRPEGVLEQMRLTDLIDQTLVLVERSIEKKGLRTVRQYEHGGLLYVDSSRIQLVILNLLTNARDAMEAGGTLTVRVFAEGDRVYFSVADTGQGIPKENLYRVFEPFFTTKGAMGGSMVPGHGLGLSVCYGIVQSMLGEIVVDSAVGAGSRFTVALPVAEPAAIDAAENALSPEGVADARARYALVLDAQPVAAEGLARILRRLGLEVIVADDWERALESSQYASFEYVFHARAADESEPDRRCRRAFEIENPEAHYVSCQEEGGMNGGAHLRRPYAFQDVVRVLAALEARPSAAASLTDGIR